MWNICWGKLNLNQRVVCAFLSIAEWDCDMRKLMIMSLFSPELGGCVMIKRQREQNDAAEGLIIVKKFLYILAMCIQILVFDLNPTATPSHKYMFESLD